MSDEQRLAEIRARADSATPGPWKWDRNEPAPGWGHQGPDLMGAAGSTVCRSIGYDADSLEIGPADMVFVAHARMDVPWLLALVERLQKRFLEERAEVDRLATTLHERGKELARLERRLALMERPARENGPLRAPPAGVAPGLIVVDGRLLDPGETLSDAIHNAVKERSEAKP